MRKADLIAENDRLQQELKNMGNCFWLTARDLELAKTDPVQLAIEWLCRIYNFHLIATGEALPGSLAALTDIMTYQLTQKMKRQEMAEKIRQLPEDQRETLERILRE